MKKKLLAGLALGVMMLGMNGVASATVIDFEDLVGQNGLPSNYAGLTWGYGWEHYDFAQFPYTSSSGVQRVYNNSNSGGDWFKFGGDVVFNGAYFSGYNSAQFELYNDGSLVHTSTLAALSSVPAFLDSGYGGMIDEVRLNVSNGSFVMDDVTYNGANSVPEPATMFLFGTGLAGLVGARLRRKK